MIIRCPQCEHTRRVNEDKIPATAELATCPKCGRRFRFRAPGGGDGGEESPLSPHSKEARERSSPDGRLPLAPLSIPPGLEVLRPQGVVREAAARQGDVWDAVDSLQQRWQAQMDQHVVEVITPRPEEAPEEAKDAPAEEPHPEVPAALEKAAAALKARLDEDSARAAQNADAAPDPGREAAPPAVFLYDENTPRPEERVERDMRLLRDTREEMPVRNLGSLRDYPDAAFSPPDGDNADSAGADADEDMEENSVPWENPAAHGWVASFAGALHGVMFRGPDFFSRLSASGSLGPGYLFFLIMGYVTILGSLLWSHALASLLPGAVQGLASRVSLPALLLLAPVALGLMLLFSAGCIRVALLLLAPEKSVFSLAYKVTSYSMAPFALSIVPFVGPVIGAAWFIAALIIGCRNALKLSWPLAVFVPLPPAAMLLGGLALYFL